jgi:hypothetical protein
MLFEDFPAQRLLEADDQPAQKFAPFRLGQFGEVCRADLFEISGGVGPSSSTSRR